MSLWKSRGTKWLFVCSFVVGYLLSVGVSYADVGSSDYCSYGGYTGGTVNSSQLVSCGNLHNPLGGYLNEYVTHWLATWPREGYWDLVYNVPDGISSSNDDVYGYHKLEFFNTMFDRSPGSISSVGCAGYKVYTIQQQYGQCYFGIRDWLGLENGMYDTRSWQAIWDPESGQYGYQNLWYKSY